MTSARNQRTFDIVATKLAQQGRPSAQARGFGLPRCMYLAPNGDRCAAGQLFELSDSEIKALGNPGVTASSGIQHHLAELDHDITFVAYLQDVHDEAAKHSLEPVVWLAEWAGRMRGLALEQGLSIDVLEQALAERVRVQARALLAAAEVAS